jgi:ferric-dicitrate binding protein FerR (iron transport regulator)
MNESKKHIGIDLLTRFFAGEVTTEEAQSVKQWAEASGENKEEFSMLEKVWTKLGSTSPDQHLDTDSEWRYLMHKIQSRSNVKKQPVWKPLMQIAAAIIIILGAVWIVLKHTGGETIQTRIAETTVTILPDGSEVTLNAGSKLHYGKDFGISERKVSLQGEAYFEVQNDTGKPFIIELGTAELQVLGTSFNVKAYKEHLKIEVTVAEGSVSVYDRKLKDKKVIATKGEKAEFDKGNKSVLKITNENINYNAWKTKKIVFRDEKLSVIANTLSEVYHKNILIGDSAVNNCTLTTSFENKDLKTVLNVLESTLGITIVEEKQEILIYGPGC